jgi:predicted  nucleic acid-binding Zn-ribbon protein
MKKTMLIFIVLLNYNLNADDERVPEPWDLQRIKIPGAVLTTQEKPDSSPIALSLKQAREEVASIMTEVNALEGKKNILQAKLQNPTLDDNIQLLKGELASIAIPLEAARKKLLKAQKKLEKLHQEAEVLQNQSSTLLN